MSIHIVTNGRILLFLWWDNIPLYTCTASSLSIYLFMDTSVQSLSHVQLFATPRIAARQASLSITNSRSSLKLMCIKSVMPSSHLILCRPLLLLPPIPPSIRVFSNDSALCMRWPSCLQILAVVNHAAMHWGAYILSN